jgi:hypothetical protein
MFRVLKVQRNLRSWDHTIPIDVVNKEHEWRWPPTCLCTCMGHAAEFPCCVLLRHGCSRRHGHRPPLPAAAGPVPDFLSRVAPVSCTLEPPVSVIPLLPGAGHVRCMHASASCDGHRNSRRPARSAPWLLCCRVFSCHIKLYTLSNRIFRDIRRALNIDKKITNYTVCMYFTRRIF